MSETEDHRVRYRAGMVEHLRRHAGLTDDRVAAVLGRVPRHLFLPGAELSEAYGDIAVPTHFRDGVACSSASQPAIVATMLEQLRPPVGGTVLEIGAGTGYNAALLSALVGPAGRVVTIDIEPDVASEARAHLSSAGVTNVEVICRDGALGCADQAPYDGIIVTVGASDIAPAWVEQLSADGRLVMPLAIRGIQHCVAFARADGHLQSVSICECGFMPMTGTMANTDHRHGVPGHEGVYVLAPAGTAVNLDVVASALDDPGPKADLGISATAMEVFGSMRRWLAFHDATSASLSYIGPPEAADSSGVPPVVDFPGPGVAQRSTPCLLGAAGFAVLDLAAPAVASDDSFLHTVLELEVRAYGEAPQEARRLVGLVAAWDAAGRPEADRLRIDAYPSDVRLPEVGAAGSVHRAANATFVVTSS